jgi:hypothetical protein
MTRIRKTSGGQRWIARNLPVRLFVSDGHAAGDTTSATERVFEPPLGADVCVLDHDALHRRRRRRLYPGHLAVHGDGCVVAHRGNLRRHRRCHLGILACEWAVRLARRLTVRGFSGESVRRGCRQAHACGCGLAEVRIDIVASSARRTVRTRRWSMILLAGVWVTRSLIENT